MEPPTQRADDPIVASILLVDDHRANLVALEAVLAPLGHRLVGASSGAEAVARVAEEEFAVVLLDVMMPGMDGFETAAKLRAMEHGAHLPIIFLTALDGAHVAARGYAAGAVDFLSKPFEPDTIAAKVGVFVDLYVQREQSKRQAVLLRERERLLGILGHDLRQPLAAITIAAELLARAELRDSESRAVRRIVSSASRMARLIEDVVEFTRSRHGGLPINSRACNLGVVCRTVIEEAEAAHPGRSVAFSADGDVAGVWDPDRLAQALANLISNALTYSPRSASVVLMLHGKGDGVVVEVCNQGAVIPAALLPTLFDPFKRASVTGSGVRPAALSAGLGLGLYIVRHIVEAHGGTVAVASDDAATTFTLVLPRVSASTGSTG